MEERLREIATYSLCDKDMSAEDKAFIRETSSALGVKFNLNKCPTCKNKYSDQVHLLIRKIREMQTEFPESTIKATKCKYKLRPELKINVIHRGVYHINADTLTDELAEILINDGFSRWFEL